MYISESEFNLVKTMKNNKIPEIQQVEATLTESEVFSLSFSFSLLAYVKNSRQHTKVAHVLDAR